MAMRVSNPALNPSRFELSFPVTEPTMMTLGSDPIIMDMAGMNAKKSQCQYPKVRCQTGKIKGIIITILTMDAVARDNAWIAIHTVVAMVHHPKDIDCRDS